MDETEADTSDADDHVPVERMFTLLDGVVAIAMTILVLDVRLPADLSGTSLRQALNAVGHQIQYFLLSVAVIGVFWQGHHQVLKRARYITRPLLWLNFAFLALLALIPFPTNTLEEYAGDTVGPALYGATIALTALVELTMWLHITKPGGPSRYTVAGERRQRSTLNLVIIAVVFAGSVPIAFINPTAATLSWLLVLPARLLLRHRFSVRPGGRPG